MFCRFQVSIFRADWVLGFGVSRVFFCPSHMLDWLVFQIWFESVEYWLSQMIFRFWVSHLIFFSFLVFLVFSSFFAQALGFFGFVILPLAIC